VRTFILGRSVALAVLVAVAVTCVAPLRANEAYYLILFGAQREPPHPKYAHTWATYVRAHGEGDDPRSYALAIRNNSWLPANLNIQVWRPCPQQGANLDLKSTLDFVMAEGSLISEWGPHQIPPEIYWRGIREIERLESGEILYRAIDGLSRRSNIKNCFHSISDVLDRRDSRAYYPLRQNGFPVTYDIIKSLRDRGYIINPGQDNTWLDRRLGLDALPIIHRPFDPEGQEPRPRGSYLFR
jgi:hypothetical protein